MAYYRAKYITKTINDKNKLEDYINSQFKCGYKILQIIKEGDSYILVFERFNEW